MRYIYPFRFISELDEFFFTDLNWHEVTAPDILRIIKKLVVDSMFVKDWLDTFKSQSVLGVSSDNVGEVDGIGFLSSNHYRDNNFL